MFQSGPANVQFEVHARRGSRWLIEATVTDIGIAQEQAQQLLQRADVDGVKIWKEISDPQTCRTAGRTLLVEEKPWRKRRWPARSRALPAQAKDASPREPDRRLAAAPPERPGDRGLALATIGSACMALVALAALAASG